MSCLPKRTNKNIDPAYKPNCCNKPEPNCCKYFECGYDYYDLDNNYFIKHNFIPTKCELEISCFNQFVRNRKRKC